MSYDKEEKHGQRGHRAQRIERTVADVLEYEILPALENPALEELHVLRVEASNNLASLQIAIVPQRREVPQPPDEIQAALTSAEGFVRSELAGILRIKRMPVIRLRYIPLPLYGAEGGGA